MTVNISLKRNLPMILLKNYFKYIITIIPNILIPIILMKM